MGVHVDVMGESSRVRHMCVKAVAAVLQGQFTSSEVASHGAECSAYTGCTAQPASGKTRNLPGAHAVALDLARPRP